jgi:hypothetical protein
LYSAHSCSADSSSELSCGSLLTRMKGIICSILAGKISALVSWFGANRNVRPSLRSEHEYPMKARDFVTFNST